MLVVLWTWLRMARLVFLYRYEEISLLAQRVCELFSNRELCERISVQERTVANSRHSKDTNATALVEIYKEIVR